ncbi:unnamed protein product, partial [marine sediment metagenome]
SIKARATTKIAQVYRHTENYKGAKEKYEEAIEIAKKAKYDNVLATAYWGYSILLRREGKFFENANSTDIARLELKVRELERLVGELTMENRMLKKVRDLNSKKKKEDLSIITSRTWDQLKKGAD